MHCQPIPEAELAEAILGLLIDDHPGHWHTAELERALAPTTATDAADALADLHATGLIHRVGDFVFATRAAHACRALAS